MNPAKIEAVLSGQRTDVRAVALRLLLSCASPIYGIAATLNRLRYDLKLATTYQVDAPVISVGNITTGGTGKTPFAAWLVNAIQHQNKKPGIASRGYKSLEQGNTTSPENRETPGNDEKMMLEQLCPGTPHLQSRNRVAVARELVAMHDCDCVILDDGFQHRKLHRDLDIVLIDAVNPFGYSHLLPRGLLRELLSSLARADLFVITRTEQVSSGKIKRIRGQLARYSKDSEKPIVEVAFEPTGYLDTQGNRSLFAETQDASIMFCGIGNPKGFQQLLEQAGCKPKPEKTFFAFPDHHHYTQEEIQNLCDIAKEIETNRLLTTQKDLVKLTALVPNEFICQAVCIEAVIKKGEEILNQKIDELFQ